MVSIQEYFCLRPPSSLTDGWCNEAIEQRMIYFSSLSPIPLFPSSHLGVVFFFALAISIICFLLHLLLLPPHHLLLFRLLVKTECLSGFSKLFDGLR